MTDNLRARAERQVAAYARMVELGGGCGLLGHKHPEMYEDMTRWDDLTENDHADIVLHLLDDIEQMRGELDTLRAVASSADDMLSALDDEMPGEADGYRDDLADALTTWQTLTRKRNQQ